MQFGGGNPNQNIANNNNNELSRDDEFENNRLNFPGSNNNNNIENVNNPFEED
jgi:hypothetical protein